MKGVKLESCASTADAMQQVQEMDRDDVAAIGNASSGKLYGLQAIQGTSQTKPKTILALSWLLVNRLKFLLRFQQKPH